MNPGRVLPGGPIAPKTGDPAPPPWPWPWPWPWPCPPPEEWPISASSSWRAQHADRVRTLPAPPHCGHVSKPSAAGMDPWPTHLVHAADDQPASQDMAAASVLVHPAAHGIEMTRGAGWPRREIPASDGPSLNRERQKRKRAGVSPAHPPARASGSRVPFRDVVAMPGSVVTVQLGQCGNQVGAELFDTLSAEIDAHPRATARASAELSSASRTGTSTTPTSAARPRPTWRRSPGRC